MTYYTIKPKDDRMTETHEYDGKEWRKLKLGETIEEGDRWENVYNKTWHVQTRGSYNTSVGKAHNSRFHQHYRAVRTLPVKPKEMVTISYRVTKEYALAQAREKVGRNENLTARFEACREVVGDPTKDAEVKRLQSELDALRKVSLRLSNEYSANRRREGDLETKIRRL